MFNLLKVWNLLQPPHDHLHLFTIMDPNLDGTFEDALVSGKGNLMDIDIHLVGDHLRNIAQHTLAVDAIDLDGSIEEELLVHVPLGIEDAGTETRFEFTGHRT